MTGPHLAAFQARQLLPVETILASIDATAEARGLLGKSDQAGVVVLTDCRLCFYAKRLIGDELAQISVLGDALRYEPVVEADGVVARFETDDSVLVFAVRGDAGSDALGELLGALGRLRAVTSMLGEIAKLPPRPPGEAPSLQYQLMRLNELRDGGVLSDLDYAHHRQMILDATPQPA